MRFMKIYLLLSACVLSLIFTYAPHVYAMGVDFSDIKPLSKVDFIPQEDFEAKTNLLEEIPFGDQYLAYQLRLPKDWNVEPVLSQDVKNKKRSGLKKRVLGPLVRYTSQPSKHLRSFFTVESVELTYEVGARNWLIHYILSHGLFLEQMGDESKKQVEAIYVEVKRDITYIVRAVAIINGARMIFVRYYLPQDLYQEEYVQQAQVLNSFQLIDREEVGVEDLKVYGFLSQSFFDYPVSWTLKAPFVRSIDRMKAMLHYSTTVGQLDGQINFYLANRMTKTSRSQEIATFKESFEIEGYEMGGYIERVKMDYHKDMGFGITEAYNLTPNGDSMLNYELWVSLMEGEEYLYVISLLTPARGEEFFTWARNIEAYRLVLKGMRQKDDTVDYYQFIQ